jgi:uncharacterized protein with GYD domain
MLFSLTADYTPAALRAMRENPDAGNRQDAVTKLVEAAGGKLMAMYFRIHDGPGAQAIFDLPDPSMVASIASIIVQSERVQNVKVDRLYTQEEVMAVRQKSRQLYSAYRPAGQ